MNRQENFQTQAKTYANKCGGTTQEKCAIMADYVEGAKYGYQYALQNPAWIDVKEEQPTEKNLYIVSDGQESSVAYWVENHWGNNKDLIKTILVWLVLSVLFIVSVCYVPWYIKKLTDNLGLFAISLIGLVSIYIGLLIFCLKKVLK